MPVSPSYVDSSITIDVRKVTLETNDRNFFNYEVLSRVLCK